MTDYPQTQYPSGWQPGAPPEPPAPAPKKRRRWPWVVGNVFGVLLIVGVLAGALGSTSTNTAAATVVTRTRTVTAPAPPASTVTVVKTVTAVPKVETKTVTAPPPAPAASISEDGVYVIGSDIPAGTWHTTGGGECYYAVLNSTDTNDIRDNNNFNGPSTVTLHSGAFQISGGCEWDKK